MKSYFVIKNFIGSFLCGTPIILTPGQTIQGEELAAAYINTIQPLTLELIK